MVGWVQGFGFPGGHHHAVIWGRQLWWGGRCLSSQSHFYLLCFGFNLFVGESFQKNRWVDPQELVKGIQGSIQLTWFYLLSDKEAVESPGPS